MATSGTYYVYEHWRLDKDECFYVGKGRGNRAYIFKGRNKDHSAIVAKVRREGFAIEVRIVQSGLSEPDSFILEQKRIQFWREIGVDLANMTNGGEGISGFHHSVETRQKLSDNNKGQLAAFKGRKHTEETKKVLSEIAKKRGAPKLTKEQQEKASNWHRGRKRSLETCAKISAKTKGRVSSMKGKESPLKGKTLSEETRIKMANAKKKWWANKKAEAVS